MNHKALFFSGYYFTFLSSFFSKSPGSTINSVSVSPVPGRTSSPDGFGPNCIPMAAIRPIPMSTPPKIARFFFHLLCQFHDSAPPLSCFLFCYAQHTIQSSQSPGHSLEHLCISSLYLQCDPHGWKNPAAKPNWNLQSNNGICLKPLRMGWIRWGQRCIPKRHLQAIYGKLHCSSSIRILYMSAARQLEFPMVSSR